jgi:hypothetical protein
LFVSVTAPKRGQPYERYACSGAVRRRDCDLRPIPRKVLEEAVLASLHEGVLTPDALTRARAEMLKSQASQIEDLEQHRSEAKARLARVKRQTNNLTNAVAEHGISRAMSDKLHYLERDEAEAQARVDQLENIAPVLPELVDDQILHLNEQLASSIPDVARMALASLVSKVIVDRDGVAVIGEIVYFYPGETMPTSRCPLGGALCRHSFSAFFTGQIRAWTRRRKASPVDNMHL